MKVRDLMSTDLKTLCPENSLQEAATLFLDYEIDGAPVMEDGKLVGLFTKTHLIRAIRWKIDMSKPIKELMTTQVKTIGPDEDMNNVDRLFTGRYPVVENGKLVGFSTKSDIMVGLNQIIDEIAGQLETVINSTYNPIIAIDNEGTIQIWNQAAENMTGFKKQDVIGNFINDIIPESELLDIVKTGKSEYGIKLKVGNWSTVTNRAPIRRNGEITGAVAVLYDVSELEKVSRELEYVKALNKEMDAIIDSSFDGLYITDEKGVTLRINQAVQRITGLLEEEFLNKNMNELVDKGILSRSASLLVMEQKKAVTTTLKTVTNHDLLVSATPVFDEEGNIFRIVTNVRDISELNMLKQKLEQMEGLKSHFEFEINQMKLKISGNLVFKNMEMGKILYQAIKIAGVDSTVLISGESGVGKEVIADIIQKNSARKNAAFVKLNCAAIPEHLLESELFGYENGAFTGARKDGKPGLFEVANGGTLLLDEIGDIPMHLQVKLLRAIQEREILRVGGTTPVKINVRIIAITNKNLENMVRRGEFREDLYYRLNVVPIYVPPLRERKEEIPLMVRHFLDNYNKRYNMKKMISPELIDALMIYNWPGNIRQLENLIERLVVTSSSEHIGIQQLPDYFHVTDSMALDSIDQPVIINTIIPLRTAVENTERILLEKTLSIANSCHKAAQILEVDPSTISRKASKYKIKIKSS